MTTYDEPIVTGPRDVARLRPFLHHLWEPGQRFARLSRSQHGMDALMAANYAHWELETLERASLWWISEEMMTLLEAAARTVPDDVTMDDLPEITASGLACFARPWHANGVDGSAMTVDAVLWGPAKLPPWVPVPRLREQFPDGAPSMTVSSYQLFDIDAGLRADEMEVAAAHLEDKVRHEGMLAEEIGQPADGTRAFGIHGHLWAPLGRSDWIIGDPVGEVDHVEPLEMSHHQSLRQYIQADAIMRGAYRKTIQANLVNVEASYVEDRKLLVAFWTLIHQAGIAQTTIDRPPRHEARRAYRDGFGPSGAEVSVVKLRRLERTEHDPDDGEHEGREWACHWVVNGHWRLQAHGPGRTLRKLIFIHPYLKGDLDKPLHKPETVRAWIR